jgi:hypothetical protein
MSLQNFDDISAPLKAHLAEEAQAGFPTLIRIPSTGTIKFLDHFSTLTAADADSLLHALARISAMRFVSPRELLDQANIDPALLRYRDALQSAPFSMGLRHKGLRMMRAMLMDRMTVEMMAKTRATLDFTPRDDMPAVLVPDPDPTHLKPAKTPLLRKLIDKMFKELFAAVKRKLPGGETVYTGVLQGTNITVRIVFAGMGLQLRYGVHIPDETKTVFAFGLGYEDLWGSGPDWDYLTEENAEASIHLLCDLVVRVVRLRNSVLALL